MLLSPANKGNSKAKLIPLHLFGISFSPEISHYPLNGMRQLQRSNCRKTLKAKNVASCLFFCGATRLVYHHRRPTLAPECTVTQREH